MIVSIDAGLKRMTTSQDKQTLQLGAFPERPGDTETPFNVGKPNTLFLCRKQSCVTVFSCGRVPQIPPLSSVCSLCLESFLFCPLWLKCLVN